jgi:hypothetical protein
LRFYILLFSTCVYIVISSTSRCCIMTPLFDVPSCFFARY